LKWIDDGKIQFLNSFALEFEVSAISDTERGLKIREYLNAAADYIEFNIQIVERAAELEKIGFIGIDAIHIAVAEYAKVDYFITCDDDILKLAGKHKETIKVSVVSITKLVSEII